MIIKPSFLESEIPLPDYPRPQFKRASYYCLNGKWEYAFSQYHQFPKKYDGFIVVPYSPESEYSEVNRQLKADEYLYYRRIINLPMDFNKGRIILNIGACDQVTNVFINKTLVTKHEGGYLPFSVDITTHLQNGSNEIILSVKDDASSDIYGRGKQRYQKGGIWYTAISGLWQTIWLESVPEVYLNNLVITPLFDEKKLLIKGLSNSKEQIIKYQIIDNDEVISCGFGKSDEEVELEANGCQNWSPNNPQLYKLLITCNKDIVESYFGLRKFSHSIINKTHFFEVNNTPLFQSGLLDQGYYGKGIYTPLNYQEMYHALEKVKKLGFNMLRKHIKVEPLLWYYYCDCLGILVWQDMLNGGSLYPPLRLKLGPFVNLHLNDKNYRRMNRLRPESREWYMIEAKELIKNLYNNVSLCLWTPFNEGWGQFDTIKVWHQLNELDHTRLFDHASGWQDKNGGDLCSRHIYFKKVNIKNDHKRILALTEFGGYTYSDPQDENEVYTYKKLDTKEVYIDAFTHLYQDEIIPCIKNQGLNAIIYTQLADVETEINGIFTTNWQLKINEENIITLNKELQTTFQEYIKELTDLK